MNCVLRSSARRDDLAGIKPLTIDLHAHWIPPALAERLRRRSRMPRIEGRNGSEQLISFLGRRTFGPDLGDLAVRRALMQRCGITMQVLSLAALHGVHCLPVQESLPLVTLFNDAAAAAVRLDPQHFSAIAALPLADIPAACGELKRAHAIGLRGAILPADAFLTRATAERFLPLFEVANRLNSHLFIHPGPIDSKPEIGMQPRHTDNAWQRYIVLETQSRLSQVMMTLEFSKYLDPYRNVTVQVANLGGAIPFLSERMDEVGRVESSSALPPSHGARRCYVDTASFGPRAIGLAVACFGSERVVLGTDCPIFDAARMLASVDEARLDTSTRGLLLSGNARRILRIENTASQPHSVA
jgi:predicted TIM-barrel fold metal-dependent hydrolase